MSTETITMCDVKGCRSEASERYKHVIVTVDDGSEGGFALETYTDVDMCGSHSFNYRSSVSTMAIKDEVNHERNN